MNNIEQKDDEINDSRQFSSMESISLGKKFSEDSNRKNQMRILKINLKTFF